MLHPVRYAIALFIVLISTAAQVGAGPATPPLELSLVLGGHPKTAVVEGTRVYAPSGRIVTTWDYTDPAHPIAVATTEQPASGQIMALTRLGDYLYAGWINANDNSGLAIYSLANPDRPTLVNEIDDYDPGLKILRTVVAANSHLYIFDSEAGVFYSPVDDPLHPMFTRAFRTPAIYQTAVAHGHYIYTRALTLMGNAALVVFDVSDPTQPTAVSGSNQYFSTELFDIHAAPPLVAGFGELLSLFDVGDPANVIARGQIQTPPATNGVTLNGYAWSFGFDGIDVWDISDLDQPAPAGHADVDLLGADVVARLGNDPLVFTRTDRIVNLDAGIPAQPTAIGQAVLPGGADARDVAIVGDTAIFLQEAYGLSIADAHTLEPLGRFDADLPAQLNMRAFETFAVDGDRAYLTAWGYGMLIIDISDPLNPVEIGRYPYEFASEIAAQGTFAYVGKSTNGGEMRIVDVADPTLPVLRGSIAANEPRRLQVRGNYAYLADGLLGGLRIIDVGNPDAPVEVALYDQDCEWLGNTAYDVVLNDAGTMAYVACPTGMHILDVSDPEQPQRIGWYVREPDVFSNRPRVDVRGDRGWYSDGSGVHEIDLSDPSLPQGLGITVLTYTSPNRLRATADDRLFAFTGPSGVHVFGAVEPPVDDTIFANGFEAAPPPKPTVSHYDDVTEGFLGTSWSYQGVTYHDVNNVGGVFPNGDTFTAADVGDQLIIERATVFFDEFPDFGSSPNTLTFGTALVPGDNLSLGAFVKARMDLDEPASTATFEMAHYENGPWIGIAFHLEAYSGDTLVDSDTFTIAGDDPNGRDNIALSSLSVSAASFDSLYLYATYDDQFSAPRLMIDNLTLTPVAR